MGIEILPPDVNLSDHEFTVEDGNVRFGLDAVKGVGYQAVEAIKTARVGGGPFDSLWDFCERVDQRAVNKKAIEALIKCGAFGSTGATRRGMLTILAQAQGAGQKVQQDALTGQGSIFDMAGLGEASANGRLAGAANGAASVASHAIRPPIPSQEAEQAELLAMEKEAIGLFVSTHPLKPLREALRARVDCPLSALSGRREKEWVTVGGIITQTKRIRTRNGEPMMFATLADLEDAVEMLLFGKALADHEASLVVDEIVLVRGRVDHKEAGRTCVVVGEVEPFRPSAEEIAAASGLPASPEQAPASPTGERVSETVRLQLDAARLPASVIEDIKRVIAEFPGSAEVMLEIDTSAGRRTLRLGEGFRVTHTPELRSELERVIEQAATPPAETIGAEPAGPAALSVASQSAA
jgi:DNA polymerase-3 subunit alpha